MDKQNNPDLCASPNYEMTPEQKSAALKRIADGMKEQSVDSLRMLEKLSSWTTDDQVDRFINNPDEFRETIPRIRLALLDLAFIELIRDIRWRTMHFIAYGEYPPEDA